MIGAVVLTGVDHEVCVEDVRLFSKCMLCTYSCSVNY